MIELFVWQQIKIEKQWETHFNFCSQSAEPLPEEDDSFELPDDYQPFLQETPLYTDNTANG